KIQFKELELKPSNVSETPVRLFKHQIEKKADSAPTAKFSRQQVSKLILNVVSQCKHKGGISMDELKETLAAEGYDVAKNNRQVKVVTEQLVNNKTLVRTTRNTSLRLNNKKPPQEPAKKTSAQKNPEEETKTQKTDKAAPKSKKQRKQSPKPKRKPQKRARKRPQLRNNRSMRAQTPPAKTKKTHRHQPKQEKTITKTETSYKKIKAAEKAS
uniref:H15 domain-containing protein n=1 Tax=Poecilia formosa TaxID=48698 RepID=A0A087Y4S3_POEFO